MKGLFDTSFQNSFVSPINPLTRVTRNSTTYIENMLTNLFIDANVEGGIFKNNISYHFLFFCCIKTTLSANSGKTVIT